MTLLADAFIPTGAYVGLVGYLACAVACVVIFWRACRQPAREIDRRLSRVDLELRRREGRG